jgi:hypothetical protein
MFGFFEPGRFTLDGYKRPILPDKVQKNEGISISTIFSIQIPRGEE